MKNPLSKLPDEKAQKELAQFTTLGLILAVIPLFAFGWLAIAGLAFSARALLLSQHEANKNFTKLKQYRAIAVVGIVLSVIDLVLLYSK